jgi:type I restriction enzyme S subunit
MINQNTGSSVPLITLGTLRKIPVLLPSMSVQHQFAAFVVNRDNLVENLERKNDNLRQTRDLLLPRLISGEIDVENLDINTGTIAA